MMSKKRLRLWCVAASATASLGPDGRCGVSVSASSHTAPAVGIPPHLVVGSGRHPSPRRSATARRRARRTTERATSATRPPSPAGVRLPDRQGADGRRADDRGRRLRQPDDRGRPGGVRQDVRHPADVSDDPRAEHSGDRRTSRRLQLGRRDVARRRVGACDGARRADRSRVSRATTSPTWLATEAAVLPQYPGAIVSQSFGVDEIDAEDPAVAAAFDSLHDSFDDATDAGGTLLASTGDFGSTGHQRRVVSRVSVLRPARHRGRRHDGRALSRRALQTVTRDNGHDDHGKGNDGGGGNTGGGSTGGGSTGGGSTGGGNNNGGGKGNDDRGGKGGKPAPKEPPHPGRRYSTRDVQTVTVYGGEQVWNESERIPGSSGRRAARRAFSSRPRATSAVSATASARTTSDVAYDASIDGGEVVIWAVRLRCFGGTSIGPPQWAGDRRARERASRDRKRPGLDRPARLRRSTGSRQPRPVLARLPRHHATGTTSTRLRVRRRPWLRPPDRPRHAGRVEPDRRPDEGARAPRPRGVGHRDGNGHGHGHDDVRRHDHSSVASHHKLQVG